MKKLLVLMLVLGLATMASAVVVYTSSPDSVVNGKITWSIIGNQLVGTGTALGGQDGYIVEQSDGSLAADSAGTRAAGLWNEAGDASKLIEDVYGYAGWWNTFASDIEGVQQATGKWFAFNILGNPTVANPVYVDVYGPVNKIDTMTIIPEPMTIALLGLGGLFLRRRK